MWHETLADAEARIRVHKRETSLMPGISPKEDSHVSIVGNLGISKRIVNILRKTNVLLMMLYPRRYMRRKALQPLLPMKKNSYSFARK